MKNPLPKLLIDSILAAIKFENNEIASEGDSKVTKDLSKFKKSKNPIEKAKFRKMKHKASKFSQ